MPLGSTPRTDPTTPAVVLVHVASFVLAEGESTGELAARFPGARLGEALESVPFVRDDGRPATDLYIRQEEFRAVSAADVDAAVAGRWPSPSGRSSRTRWRRRRRVRPGGPSPPGPC